MEERVFMAVAVGLVTFLASLPETCRPPIDRRHITSLSVITDPYFLVFRLPFFFTLLLSIWLALSRIDTSPHGGLLRKATARYWTVIVAAATPE
jgi:hypothetical protein